MARLITSCLVPALSPLLMSFCPIVQKSSLPANILVHYTNQGRDRAAAWRLTFSMAINPHKHSLRRGFSVLAVFLGEIISLSLFSSPINLPQ